MYWSSWVRSTGSGSSVKTSSKRLKHYHRIVLFKDRRIRLESKDLDIGRSYHIRSSEQLEYRDSDEWLFTYGITKGDMTLSISFPEPNEDYIEKQSRKKERSKKMIWKGIIFM